MLTFKDFITEKYNHSDYSYKEPKHPGTKRAMDTQDNIRKSIARTKSNSAKYFQRPSTSTAKEEIKSFRKKVTPKTV